jgi:chromosome segregation protein
VNRYGDLLREFARQSQFIMITHNKGTMEAADVLYGVTMEEAGASKLIGMRLRDPGEERGAQSVVPMADEEREEPAAEEAA